MEFLKFREQRDDEDFYVYMKERITYEHITVFVLTVTMPFVLILIPGLIIGGAIELGKYLLGVN